MRRTLALVVALASLPAAAIAASDSPRVFAIAAQNGSGESGTVTLVPLGTTQTKVEVALVGAPGGVIQPAHIHVGPCATLTAKPTYGLAAVTDGYSETTVPVAMSELVSGRFAVNVHKSGTEVATYVACGDLGAK